MSFKTNYSILKPLHVVWFAVVPNNHLSNAADVCNEQSLAIAKG